MKRTRKRRDVTCDTVSSWADLDSSRARVGIAGRFGGALRASRAISRLNKYIVPYWVQFAVVLETCRGHMGPSLGHLGHIGGWGL